MSERDKLFREAMNAAEARGFERARRMAAQIADNIAADPPHNDDRHIDWQIGWQDGAMETAAAIRAMKPEDK